MDEKTPPLTSEIADPSRSCPGGPTAEDLRIKNAELSLHEREVALKEYETYKGWWRNPVFVGVIAAFLGFISGLVSKYIEGRNASALEHQRFEIAQKTERLRLQSSLILEAIKTGDPEHAATNLAFLVELGYIDDNDGRI